MKIKFPTNARGDPQVECWGVLPGFYEIFKKFKVLANSYKFSWIFFCQFFFQPKKRILPFFSSSVNLTIFTKIVEKNCNFSIAKNCTKNPWLQY
jgi:hypothetical protein